MKGLCLVGFILISSCAFGGHHSRDGAKLPAKEKEFASQLSARQRRIFCGRFSHSQRELAIKMARGKGQDKCFTPDEAVMKVMEETGMSLAVKSRKEIE